MRRLVTCLAVVLAAGCGSPTPSGNDVARAPAGIVLSLSTDLMVPQQLDELQIQVDVGSSTAFFQTYSVPNDASLPGTLVLQASQAGDLTAGTINPGIIPVTQAGTAFTVTVTGGMHGGTALVTRKAKLTMPPAVKTLDFPIEAACATVVCSDGQTCSKGSCIDENVDSSTLPAN